MKWTKENDVMLKKMIITIIKMLPRDEGERATCCGWDLAGNDPASRRKVNAVTFNVTLQFLLIFMITPCWWCSDRDCAATGHEREIIAIHYYWCAHEGGWGRRVPDEAETCRCNVWWGDTAFQQTAEIRYYFQEINPEWLPIPIHHILWNEKQSKWVWIVPPFH